MKNDLNRCISFSYIANLQFSDGKINGKSLLFSKGFPFKDVGIENILQNDIFPALKYPGK